jgi:hypothetical protein
MAEILQLPHLVEHHGMSKMDVRGRWIQAELDPQRLAGRLGALQLLHPLFLGQQFVDPAKGDFKGSSYTIGEICGCNKIGIHGTFWLI